MCKIKICGLVRPVDAEYINEALPDYAGFIFYKKSQRFIDDTLAMKLRDIINPKIATVGVFVDDSLKHIEWLYKNKVISIIQLHGHEDEKYICSLRQLLPTAEIWKAFIIRSEDDIKLAANSSADVVLLDNGYGTGKSFDFSLINNFNRRFILAGGLTPENIAITVRNIRPWTIDISSGVETDGFKDKKKIDAAIRTARSLNEQE